MEISTVKLRKSQQICTVDKNNIQVKQHSQCIIETEHGTDVGTVLKNENSSEKENIEGKILRIIEEKDLNALPAIEEIEKKAFSECKQKAKEKKLELKLVTVKSLFDKTKIIFYFVAENRVDFRELVRELASSFKTRIEMRQIGVRDEARLVGGFGPCGKELCCVHQMEGFEPVSIKMAKEQGLNLNSLKISGMCGRLLCCLGYEYNVYKDLNSGLPKYGSELLIGNEKFTIKQINTLKESISIYYHDRFVSIPKNKLDANNKKYSVKQDTVEKLKEKEAAPTNEDGNRLEKNKFEFYKRNKGNQ